MNKSMLCTGIMTLVLVGGTAVHADDTGFTWEGAFEIGVDSTVRSDDPTAELTDTYLTFEAAFEAALSDRITAFGGVTLESVTDPISSREFENLGLYFAELGLRFSFGDTDVSVGKISPIFAVAWDEAPGFYGTTLAEDYELSEMIGLTVDTTLGTNGALSVAVFYADDTGLSNSIGTKRGRNTVTAGGVANTSKLNNVALQYTHDFGDTTAWVGARHLSAGVGDVSDEKGLVAGMTHDFGNGYDVIAEIAHFKGASGTNGDATYATLGAAYALNAWTFSTAATFVDNSAAGTDSMIAFGVDRALSESTDLNFGIARFDVGGVKSTSLAMAAIISF